MASASPPSGAALSSIAEPNPSLFKGGSNGDAKSVADTQLRADVKAMGSLLGQVIQDHHGSEIFDRVEHLRNLAKKFREAGGGRDAMKLEESRAVLSEMATYVSTLNNEELFLVSRSFTHFLALANAAEGHHRIRLMHAKANTGTGMSALSSKSDSCGGVLPQLAKEHDADAIFDALTSQTVELVLTAHPTEVNRRTILDKQRRVQSLLTLADRYRASGEATPYKQVELNDALYREISSIWLSDEVAREKPSVQSEAARGTLVVETVLWETLPQFLRKLNSTLVDTIGKKLPLDAAPLKFASWMGGDRDGNPNVTSTVTREVCLTNRITAATLLHRDLTTLESELSITNCSQELRDIVGDDEREPYRCFLEPMIQKLDNTKTWAQQKLDNIKANNVSDDSIPSDIYLSKKDFMDDLMLMHRSLSSTGNEITANGRLTDIIRNVSAFGLTLVPLDVRQESDRHMEVLDSITRFLGLGSYEQWDEQTRISWIQQQLASNRPLLRPGVWNKHPDKFSPTTVEALETFSMIADQHDDSLGAYVISQATSASDVLAVLLLQRDAGVKNPLRVVPLFETLDDLNGAADTMDSLFSLPGYMGSIAGKQEIMIGYSDSAKDAGRLAASWAQYETQEKLAAVANKYGVEVTFFHGKGGTVGRGGNPATFKAIMAHAPDTINGQFRVTEQGEMINQNFGHGDRAERTLDIYTAAVLAEKLKERVKPPQEWRDMMGKLSELSCDAYRGVVRGDERFVPYFRSMTPETELANLNIGSRPAKRKATGGVESLRAIPWIFAWMQTRLNLPSWLGVGDAIGQVMDSDDADKLQEMYEGWDSFRTTIDLVEMVLAKSEPTIARHYDKTLVTDASAQEFGEEIRAIHASTEKAVLALAQHTTLSEDNTILRRMLEVRNPYVDCLNVLQAETLKRRRDQNEGEEDPRLKDALMTTIAGVANGMGNTG
eukprot:CAMPEP_0195285440 /NCGR_PEP_ID=MMETSP0707-20130614/3271_1 /TAXON_ID=33640 /ORGANISM="Asterionellopsis glacialis, Strain CCMP134" /LENGTH=948 /DNA_ID=CAMNT_0040344931 /DNA_START=228 /DNA_END=3074 /DNA_ORIENTATION=+